MENIRLVKFIAWLGKQFGLDESIKKVGHEVLSEVFEKPLTKYIKDCFSTKDEAKEFTKRILTQETETENPEEDIIGVYKEVTEERKEDELMEALKTFFTENQGLLERINQQKNIQNNKKGKNVIKDYKIKQKAKVIRNKF